MAFLLLNFEDGYQMDGSSSLFHMTHFSGVNRIWQNGLKKDVTNKTIHQHSPSPTKETRILLRIFLLVHGAIKSS